MAKTRQSIPDQVLQDVLLRSRRRCSLCYAEGKNHPQAGAIAHIDHDPTNNNGSNLIFLCLNHHEAVDDGRFLNEEIKLARDRLYDEMGAESRQSGFVHEWREFENHVRDLFNAELAASHKDAEVFQNKMYVGRSGVSHEVEISVEVMLAGVKLLMVVESKRTKRKIGASDIMAFVAAVDDIGANKGVFVTSSGFSKSAIDIARTKGIALVTLGDAKGQWNTVSP